MIQSLYRHVARTRHLGHRGLRRFRTDGLRSVLYLVPRYLVFRVIHEGRRFRWRTRLRHAIHRIRYDAPADPWQTIDVDPNTIERANYELTKEAGLGLIVGGRWDQPSRSPPLEAYWSVRGLRERFETGLEWEDTVYYQTAVDHLDRHGAFWGYSDIETFRDERCAFVDSLYSSMRDHGYRSNASDGHEVPEVSFKQKPHQHLEVLVVIGRDGRLYLRDGHHRLTVAQLLDIDRIPVHVLGRHAGWQETREAIASEAMPPHQFGQRSDDFPHPDLRDLSN